METKGIPGHFLKAKLIGMLEQDIPNKSPLFKLTEHNDYRANNIIEKMHKCLKIG